MGNDWQPDPSTGLAEVADVTHDPFDQLRFGWQIDFEGGGRQASIQSESVSEGSVWLWLARLQAGSDGSGGIPTIEPVTIGSGFDGLASVHTPREDGGDRPVELLWEADGWVNRLSLAGIDRNTAHAADARAVTADVDLAARGDWRTVIERGNGLFVGRSPILLMVPFLVAVAVAVAWVLAAARLLGRRRGTIAAVLVGLVCHLVLGTCAGDALAALIGLLVGAVVAAAAAAAGSADVGPASGPFGLGAGPAGSVDYQDEGNPR